MLHIYNSLTKQKEVFKPIIPNQVGLYVCGMTVYDFCHIGHGRVLTNFDFMVRYFRYRGFDVTYVRNITDIDDKIIKRAEENGESVTELTTRFIAAMHEDEKKLNVLPASQEPLATGHMPDIINMIQALIDKDYAYVADNGDVYYDVTKFANYGNLAHKDLDDLQAGARVAITDAKHNPLDFVLWKMAKPGEPSWESPWGAGRPGWHIECSAMSTTCLGEHFDIHGGGFDLKFPHHENEIAQSEAATGKPFVNMWIHIGFVQINKEKMSKSLGNFFTIREVFDAYHPEVIRYFMISSHYRSPVNYSQESLNIAKGALERFYTALRDLPEARRLTETDYEARFIAAMDDDFNTPEALAVLFDLTHEINRIRQEEPEHAAKLGALLRYLGDVLGILQLDANTYLQTVAGLSEDKVAHVEALIVARDEARAQKNWAKADELRDKLTALGVVLEDGASGTTWRAE